MTPPNVTSRLRVLSQLHVQSKMTGVRGKPPSGGEWVQLRKNLRSDRRLQPELESSICCSIARHATAVSCLSAAGVRCRLRSPLCPNLEFRARCYPERKFINMHPHNRLKQHRPAWVSYSIQNFVKGWTKRATPRHGNREGCSRNNA